MTNTDKTLTCQECGQSFTFTAEDQQFFASKGYTEPKRCPSCRSARKSERNSGSGYGSERTMHSVTCAECGQTAEVPFEPRGDRPVYCRDCFSKRAPSRSRY